MKTLIYKTLTILLLLSNLASCQESRNVRVTVVEEDGTPIEKANVSIHYVAYKSENSTRFYGESDAEGLFQATDRAILRILVRVNKKGYYETDMGKLSRTQDHDLTCVLRKKIRPIALHARRLQVIAPVTDEAFYYDCMIGDWVEPYGIGKISDLIFTAKKIRQVDQYKDYHYELTLQFSNDKDGFVKFDLDKYSQLKAPHKAPDFKNYKKVFHYFKKRQPGKGVETNASPNRGYFFRLRTQVDEKDNIVSCHYAKAYGDIPDLDLYFNPTPNDRNLEFDPTKNLFQNLGSSEQVREP